MIAFLIATFAAAAAAMPSYIAVPADQIAFVDLSSLHVRRVPRQTLTPPPLQNLYSQDYQPIPLQYQPIQQDHLSSHVHGVPQQTLTPPPLQNLYSQEYQPIPLQYQQIKQDPVALSPQEQEAPARLVRLQQPHDASGAASIGPAQQLAERPPDFGEYVDFGAHTGDNGAFGWYADFPVNNQDDHHGYRK